MTINFGIYLVIILLAFAGLNASRLAPRPDNQEEKRLIAALQTQIEAEKRKALAFEELAQTQAHLAEERGKLNDTLKWVVQRIDLGLKESNWTKDSPWGREIEQNINAVVH